MKALILALFQVAAINISGDRMRCPAGAERAGGQSSACGWGILQPCC